MLAFRTPRPAAGAAARRLACRCRRAGAGARALRDADTRAGRQGGRRRTGDRIRPVRHGAAGRRSTTTSRSRAYLNAQKLAPDEIRWPYYLAGLYKSRGETDKAEAAFKRALELKPDDLATLIWLGRLHLDQGRPEAAEPLFTKALRSCAADGCRAGRARTCGRGQARLPASRRNISRTRWPSTPKPRVFMRRSPRRIAASGQLDKAQPHLRQWRNRDIYVPDPLQQELDMLLDSALSYELRGVRSFEVRDWQAAVAYFRKGIGLAPDNSPISRSLHHKLGTALYLTGDLPGAQAQFEDVVRQAPPVGTVDEASAKAHYSLGVLLASKGQVAAGGSASAAAVQYQPNYVEAHMAVADVLRRSGRGEASLTHYRDAIAINPRQTTARLGYAMALVQLRRDREARDWLDESVRLYGDRADLKIALARCWRRARTARVRDGARATTIASQLFDAGEKSTSLGETIAMAEAEQGQLHTSGCDPARSYCRCTKGRHDRELFSACPRTWRSTNAASPRRTPWMEDDLVSVLNAHRANSSVVRSRRSTF